MVVINNLNFNQDYSCLSLSTTESYKIFNCDPFGEFYSSGRRGTDGGGQGGNTSGGRISYSRTGSFTLGMNSSSHIGMHNNVGNNISISEPSVEVGSSPTSFVKMLFSTSLTIIVPQNTLGNGDRLLKLYNLKQNLKICELTFPAHIVEVMLNRKRLCVVLESGHIYIYDLSCVRLMKILEIEPPRWCKEESRSRATSMGQQQSSPPLAGHDRGFEDRRVSGFVGDLCADDRSLLVLPLSLIKELTDLFNLERSGNVPSQPSTPLLRPVDNSIGRFVEFTHKSQSDNISPSSSIEDLNKDSKGWILVYDTIHLKPRLIYKAHETSLAKISISNDASIIATASHKGTIIRTCTISEKDEDSIEIDDEFDESPKKLKIERTTNLRRGHNTTKVTCLAFSLDNNVLGSASESGTIHFFRLNEPDILLDPSLDDDSLTEFMSRSSDDLNDNLALLLLNEEQQQQGHHHHQHQHQGEEMETSPPKGSPGSLGGGGGYFHNFKNMTLLNNTYTKSLVKKLPYKYLENLWEPPRRSFAFVKIPESDGSQVEIGFTSSTQVVLASYSTGTFYHYQFSMTEREREEAVLLNEFSLI